MDKTNTKPTGEAWERFLASREVFTIEEALDRLGLMTAEELTGAHECDLNPESTDTHAHYYGGCYITENRNAGTFHLYLERSDWTAKTREELEPYLFEWWLAECDGKGWAPKNG
jgi:hypothetical protein